MCAYLVQTFIAEEEKLGVERNRIVVGEISQGGATSLYSLLTIPQSPLAGIIGLSTWLPLHKKFPDVSHCELMYCLEFTGYPVHMISNQFLF